MEASLELNLRRGGFHYLKQVLFTQLSTPISVKASEYKPFQRRFILVRKVFYRVAVHSKIKIDDERVEEGHYVFKDSISHVVFITLGQEFFKAILAEAFFLCHKMKVGKQGWIFSVKNKFFSSADLLFMLLLCGPNMNCSTSKNMNRKVK